MLHTIVVLGLVLLWVYHTGQFLQRHDAALFARILAFFHALVGKKLLRFRRTHSTSVQVN
jgi:hypothetical protein